MVLGPLRITRHNGGMESLFWRYVEPLWLLCCGDESFYVVVSSGRTKEEALRASESVGLIDSSVDR